MSRKEELVKYVVIIPLIIAVIITALFVVVYNTALKSLVFTEQELKLSDYSYAEILEAEPQNIEPDNHKIYKSELTVYGDNTIIGNVLINGSSMPIIFNGNEMNCADRLNMTDFSKLPGEAGSVYLFCNKKDSASIKALEAGNVISVETYYGAFDYEIRETLSVDSDINLNKCADSYGRSMVIFTDDSTGYGIGNSYYAVIAELVSDDIVVE